MSNKVPDAPRSGAQSTGRLPRLPLTGRERVEAVRELRRMVAEGFTGVATLLRARNFSEADIALLLDCHRMWWSELVDAAYREADTYVRWSS